MEKVAGRRRQGQRGWRPQGLRTRAVEQVRCTDWMAAWRRASRGGGIKVESDQRLKPYQAVKARPLTLLVPAPRPPTRAGRAPSGVRNLYEKRKDLFFIKQGHMRRAAASAARCNLYDLPEARAPSVDRAETGTVPVAVRYRAVTACVSRAPHAYRRYTNRTSTRL